MQYQAPPGGASDAPYLDGNRSAGIKGSVVPAKAVEHPQRELAHLISFSGQDPSPDDLEQVRKAIQSMIDAATGGGETSQYLLVSQARARLPIFPEIQSADGRINVSSPAAGTILVPPSVAFLHRGIFPLNTSDIAEVARTFATAANKVYHLRWNPTDGFVLRDTANAGYNPGALPEYNATFDSGYDDMLVARISTSSGNVATVTNLANRNRLSAKLAKSTFETGTGGGEIWAGLPRLSVDLNWARSPTVGLSRTNAHITGLWESITHIGHGIYNGDTLGGLDAVGLTRYGGEAWCLGYIFNPGGAVQPTNRWASFPFVMEAWA